MLDSLLLLTLANAVLALPLAFCMARDFARLGHISRPVAVWSGVTMHGHALLTFGVAWIDRGSLAGPSQLSALAGFGVLIVGAGIIAGGRFAYGSQRRVYGLMEDALIERGIYKWTRNPQYVGYALMFFGAALAALSLWGFVLAAAFAGLIHFHITLIEEPHLTRQFGKAYAMYCKRVPRYLGRT